MRTPTTTKDHQNPWKGPFVSSSLINFTTLVSLRMGMMTKDLKIDDNDIKD